VHQDVAWHRINLKPGRNQKIAQLKVRLTQLLTLFPAYDWEVGMAVGDVAFEAPMRWIHENCEVELARNCLDMQAVAAQHR